jgi:hypothetical protein
MKPVIIRMDVDFRRRSGREPEHFAALTVNEMPSRPVSCRMFYQIFNFIMVRLNLSPCGNGVSNNNLPRPVKKLLQGLSEADRAKPFRAVASWMAATENVQISFLSCPSPARPGRELRRFQP